MRAHLTHTLTALTRRNVFLGLFVALLTTSVALGVASKAQANSPELMFTDFYADLTYISPGEYELHGLITADAPQNLTIQFTGVVTGSVVPDSDGSFSYFVQASPGMVTATVTENGDTAEAEAELPEEF